jgi:gliding motility-associated-like protein
MSKYIYILIVFFLVSFFAKAQTNPIQNTSNKQEELTEEKIAQLLEDSRKSGTKDWEIAIKKNLLYQQKGRPSTSQNAKNTAAPPHVNATSCTNPGFEDGTTNGWTFFSGQICSPLSKNLPCNTCPTTAGAIDVVTNATGTFGACNQDNSGFDYYSGLSAIAPGAGNTHSLLLNDACTNGKIEKAAYSFVVSPQTNIFTFQYAVVLNSGGHSANSQPYFHVDATDITTGQVIPCTQYDATAPASGNLNGWTNSVQDNTVYWYPWTSVAIDLSAPAYSGHTIQVQFIVSDCNQCGHFGYCYIDASCNSNLITLTKGICPGGGPGVLTGPPGFASYSWVNSSAAVVGTSQVLTTSTPGSYTLNTTSATSCPSPSMFATLTASPAPNPVFTDTVTPCSGNAVFTDGSTVSSGSIVNWQWNWGDGSPVVNAASGATQNHSYVPGNYTVTLIDSTSGGCKATYTTVVNAAGGGPSLASTSNSPPTAPQCFLGNNVQFTNTSTAPAGTTITGYQWDFGDGNTATSTTVTPGTSHSYTTCGTFVVTLTVTSTTCNATLTQTVLINPSPTASFTVPSVCLGNPSVFTSTAASVAPCTSTYTYNWAFGDGSAPSTLANPSHTYATANTFAVTLTVTAAGGCSVTATGNASVTTTPTVAVNSGAICPGSTITLTANSNASAFIWSLGTGLSATTGSTVSASPAATTIYTITAGVGTCTGTATSTVTINSTIAATFSATTVCAGQPTIFTNITVGASTYDWAFGDGNTATANPNPSNTYSAAGSYVATLSVTTAAGCAGTGTNTVVVNPIPQINSVSSLTVCDQAQVVVSNFSSIPTGCTFAWTNTNSSINLAANGAGNIASFAGSNGGLGSPNTAGISVTPTLNGCVGLPTTFSVTVNPIPTMTVTSPAPYCPGALVSSTDYNININPITATFTWTANNNAPTGMPLTGMGAAPNSSYNAPANSSNFNQLSIISYTPSINGCIGLPVTETLTIKPTPTMVAMQDQSFCPGSNTNAVNLSSVPTSTASTYSWSYNTGGGVPSTGAQNPFPSLPTSNPGLSTLVTAVNVTPTLNGCVGPPSGFNIFVYPNPIPKFSYVSACEGSPIKFTDLSKPNTGSITVNQWNWDMNSDGLYTESTTQNPGYIVSPAGTNTIGLLVYTNSNPPCWAVTTQTVYVNPNPVIDFSGDTLKSCSPRLTNFTPTVTTTPVAGISMYAWSFGNGSTSSSATPAQQTYTNSSATQRAYYAVSLTVTTSAGCVGTKTKNNYIQVYPRPIADFGWGPVGADIDAPTVDFVNQSIGASGYPASNPTVYGTYGVEYYLGDVFAMNQNSNNVYTNAGFSHTYEYYEPYTYYVTQWVVNNLGCKDSITKPVEILPNFTFYIPNAFSPNGDGANEGFKGTGVGIDNTTYNLWVFDRWGMMIFYADDLEKSWDGHMKGNADKPVLQEDVYVWKVKFSDFRGKKHEYHGTVTLLR